MVRIEASKIDARFGAVGIVLLTGDVLRSGAVKRGALTLFKCSSGTGGKHTARRTTHPSGLRSPKPAAIVSCPGWLSGAFNWTSAVRRIAA